MTDDPFLAHRGLLFTVAYEMLGSAADAEDVLQESWLKWSRVDRATVQHPRAYLVRVSPGRPWTGRSPWPGDARSTSGRGCPNRC